MTNTAELEAAIARSRIPKRILAANMHISRAAFYNKINNKSEFKASEIEYLTKTLNLQNNPEIFFQTKVINNHAS